MIKDLYIKGGSGGQLVPILPSGTYIPKPSVVGDFDLLWLSPTENVTVGDGEILRNSGSGWNGSSYFTIEHTGDFTLNFYIDFSASGTDLMFGLDYYKASNSFEHIDFSFYRVSSNVFIFESGIQVYEHSIPINDSTKYTISRIDNTIIYLIDSNVVRTVTITNLFTMNVDCSIFNLGIVKNIQIIIP